MMNLFLYAAIQPIEICDGIDNNCNGWTDDQDPSLQGGSTYYLDADGDAHGNSNVAQQSCTQPSGYVLDNTDCDDSEALRNPSAPEICDGIDNDCDELTDDDVPSIQAQPSWYLDADGDGYGYDNTTVNSCAQPPSYELATGDCDDFDVNINPSASEVCDGLDNNCDGQIDEGVQSLWYYDADGDGYGSNGATTSSCTEPSGYADNPDDCDDLENTVYPNAAEI